MGSGGMAQGHRLLSNAARIDRDAMRYWMRVDFGPVALPADEKAYFTQLNNELSALCMCLPKSTQAEALLFLMQYYGISIGHRLDFFRNYYAPAWSINYWLEKRLAGVPGAREGAAKMAISAQAMALFLHSLDNHLNEGDVPASHVTLLLRSQAWLILNHAVLELASGVDKGEQTVQRYLDIYYHGIAYPEEAVSLEGYCQGFISQMATGFIVPVLLAKRFAADGLLRQSIEDAYAAFGIAWRLLDDIHDIEMDIRKGQHTAVYAALPKDMRRLWDECSDDNPDEGEETSRLVVDFLWRHRIVHNLLARINRELRTAAWHAEKCGMLGLANEFKCLNVSFRAFEDIP